MPYTQSIHTISFSLSPSYKRTVILSSSFSLLSLSHEIYHSSKLSLFLSVKFSSYIFTFLAHSLSFFHFVPAFISHFVIHIHTHTHTNTHAFCSYIKKLPPLSLTHILISLSLPPSRFLVFLADQSDSVIRETAVAEEFFR